MRIDLDMIPVVCRRALEERASRVRMHRFVERCRRVLDAQKKERERRLARWARGPLSREDGLRLQEVAVQGALEARHLKRALDALSRWASGGGEPDLQRALLCWDSAHRCWKRTLRTMLELGPATTDRPAA